MSLIILCMSHEIIYQDPYYFKIKNVSNVVNHFLIKQNLLNCFKKENFNTLLLKCWRDNELIDVVIDIQKLSALLPYYPLVSERWSIGQQCTNAEMLNMFENQ